MTIISTCRILSANLSRDLRRATSPAMRLGALTTALQTLRDSVLPALDHLAARSGEGSRELAQARNALLDLVTLVCVDFNRSCTDYRDGISLLETVSAACRDTVVRHKLVAYTNQLKKRYAAAEPGGITHAPRARKKRDDDPGARHTGSIIGLLLLGVVLALILFSPERIPRLARLQAAPAQPAVDEAAPEAPRTAPRREPEQFRRPEPPAPPAAAPAAPAPGSFYTFTDTRGTVHIVDNLASVPQQYRRTMKVSDPGPAAAGSTTPVAIQGNQVIVPVTLSHRGRIVTANLLLDTGATITTINEQTAARLGVESGELQPGRARVADGRTVTSYNFTADLLRVGPKDATRLQVSVLPGSGGEGHDGLLGMNFLRNFRYGIDMNRAVIEWGG